MPKGIKGYRWVQTGPQVWQLEGDPGHFHGRVYLNGDNTYTWVCLRLRHQGEEGNRSKAMFRVERIVIHKDKEIPC